MSSGRFTTARYEADYEEGAIHRVRVQPETLELATQTDPVVTNAGAEGSITNPISAVVSLGNRAFGLRPRRVVIKFDDETELEGYDERSVLTLPVLTRAMYDALVEDNLVTYLERDWRIVSKDDENVR